MTEETQTLAEDYLRMYCARVKKSELPEPYQTECDKTILVIGGGAAGLSAALEAGQRRLRRWFWWKKRRSWAAIAAKMYRQTPTSYPFTTLAGARGLPEDQGSPEPTQNPGHDQRRCWKSSMASPVCWTPTSTVGNDIETLRVGAVVMAAGWKPYDATKLTKLGYGLSKDVITSIEMEEMAKDGQDRAALRRQGPRDRWPSSSAPAPGTRSICPTAPDFCCTASLKQALYVRQPNPNATAMILYKDIRTPGQTELFYKEVQSDPGVMLTKAEIAGVSLGNGGKS